LSFNKHSISLKKSELEQSQVTVPDTGNGLEAGYHFLQVLSFIVDAGYVDAFLAAALTRVMRAAVPIPAVAAASVLHSAAVDGSVVGDVGPL